MQALIEISKSINFFDSILISFPWKVPSRNQRKETQYEFTLYKHTVKICRSCKYFVEWSIGFLAKAEQPLFLFWTSLHSMKFLYKSFFLSTDIHLFTTSHSRVSSHFHRHVFQKKKKIIPTISTDFALILSPSNHLHQIKYLIQSLYPFLFGSCLTILSMQERWKKKKYAESAILFKFVFTLCWMIHCTTRSIGVVCDYFAIFFT